MGCQAEHPMPDLFSTDTVRDASPPRPKPSVTTGVSRCAAAPLELPYAPAAAQNHRALS